MGRHAASDKSTVSPPRSTPRTLRDLAEVSGPRTAHRAAATTSTEPIDATELIARFRTAAAAPVPPTTPLPTTKPLRAPHRIARHAYGNAVAITPACSGPHVGAPRPSGRHRGGSAPGVLAVLRPVPSIRVAVRPALTAAVIITAVGLLEGPNLLTTSHATSTDRASVGAVFDPTAERAATVAAAASAPAASASTMNHRYGGAAAAAATTPSSTPSRVSRSTRAPLQAPIKAAAAHHVAVLKPGQTVAGTWVRPSTGRYTSCFCSRWGSFHAGIDLASPLGTPILAVGDGTVIKAGPASGFGHWVVIQHANGDVSIYGHMKYFFVHVGQKVKAGQKIALVGDQGFSTGPHLHFEIHRGGFDGPKINPIPWLKARGIVIGALSSDG